MQEIKIWAQMFWEDGTVSQGRRIPAEWLDDPKLTNICKMAEGILDDLNRVEGYLLLWGAGNILFGHFPTSFLSLESAILVLEP